MNTDPLWHDACPCTHPWEEHNKTVGCLNGWEYDDEGILTVEGCGCQLAHCERSNDDFV